MKHIVVIGVGLIGGSFAKAIKKCYPDIKIYGMDISEHHLQKAINLNIIDAVATQNQLEDADLILLSVPVNEAVQLLPEILNNLALHTLVIDVGSTKQAICQAVQHHPKRNQFLATHPIAGTEFSGPEAALEQLFFKKTNIICEIEKTAFKLQQKALAVFNDLGMLIRYMDPKAHDVHIAYVSHLSHISSFMLGKTVMDKEENEKDIFDLAGSGFESTVRLAKSSPTMWSAIFQQNKANVLEALELYIQNLQTFKDLIATENQTALHETMKNTNRIKEILNGINQ
jgi:prephenate dehydrogenase